MRADQENKIYLYLPICIRIRIQGYCIIIHEYYAAWTFITYLTNNSYKPNLQVPAAATLTPEYWVFILADREQWLCAEGRYGEGPGVMRAVKLKIRSSFVYKRTRGTHLQIHLVFWRHKRREERPDPGDPAQERGEGEGLGRDPQHLQISQTLEGSRHWLQQRSGCLNDPGHIFLQSSDPCWIPAWCLCVFPARLCLSPEVKSPASLLSHWP